MWLASRKKTNIGDQSRSCRKQLKLGSLVLANAKFPVHTWARFGNSLHLEISAVSMKNSISVSLDHLKRTESVCY